MSSPKAPGCEAPLPRIIVTRHPAAMAWALADLSRRGWRWHRAVFHACAEDVRRAADIFGILPAHLAAAVCHAGGRYHHLAIDVPAALRGVELDMPAFLKLRPRWERLVVTRSDSDRAPIHPPGAH
jgi:putative CRISPR-associated protein (TIGR02620 family)